MRCNRLPASNPPDRSPIENFRIGNFEAVRQRQLGDSQVYSTPVSGVKFWFPISSFTDNGLSNRTSVGSSTCGLKRRGNIKTTSATSSARMNSTR